jgi:hypothetical protein
LARHVLVPPVMSTTTAWGKGNVREQVEISQRAEGKEFATVIELLEGPDGASMVRFAYSTGGKVRRGPVTLRAPDLARLKKALAKKPALAAALAAALPNR